MQSQSLLYIILNQATFDTILSLTRNFIEPCLILLEPRSILYRARLDMISSLALCYIMSSDDVEPRYTLYYIEQSLLIYGASLDIIEPR